MSTEQALEQELWEAVCNLDDLIPNSGICTLVNDQQVAVFYLPGQEPSLYAVSNWDPIGKANVISRGIPGSIGDELVVASPLYKQHFSLTTGQCLEDSDASLQVYAIRFNGDDVEICVPG